MTIASLMDNEDIRIEDLNAENQNFYELGNKVSNGVIYDYNGRIFIDGFIGEREWQDKDLIAESNESKLYMKSDNDYIYICAVYHRIS